MRVTSWQCQPSWSWWNTKTVASVWLRWKLLGACFSMGRLPGVGPKKSEALPISLSIYSFGTVTVWHIFGMSWAWFWWDLRRLAPKNDASIISTVANLMEDRHTGVCCTAVQARVKLVVFGCPFQKVTAMLWQQIGSLICICLIAGFLKTVHGWSCDRFLCFHAQVIQVWVRFNHIIFNQHSYKLVWF